MTYAVEVEAAPQEVAKHSLAVAGWTVVSRITGFGRVVTIAAVLGPTYLGNTYQALNTIPNLTYSVLTGSLFVTLLVPPLVRHVDTKDRRATAELAGGFLGVMIAMFAAAIALVVVAGPLLLRVLSLGVGDPVVAASQRRVGWLLLVMLMPQVILYAIAGTGAAVMNAHGRFALAAAAPAMENIGIIATLGALAVIFGTGASLTSVPMAQVQLLGWGTTAAVGLHAATQWWGARCAGVRLIPRAGWRNPEVRQIIRRAVPSLGYSGLSSLRSFAVLVVANRVPGGVVAFALAFNFTSLPTAVGAEPVAVALLPQLSRLFDNAKLQRFRDELVRGASLTCFLIVPAAIAYLVLARPLAEAISFGRMASASGITLVAASLAALSLSVLGDSGFLLATYSSYARHDARSPFQSMALRTVLTLSGLLFAFLAVNGTAVLVALGLVMSAADLAAAWYLAGRVRRNLPTTGERLTPALRRALGGAALMAGPAYLIAAHLPSWLGGRWTDQLGMLAAVLAGLAIFIGVQRLWRSPELAMLLGGFRQLLYLRPASRMPGGNP
jgi:putative peptidoglycan lipid II flippase